MIITPNEDDIFNRLRAFLRVLFPDETLEIITAQENRVPEPTNANYIEMTPLRMPRLSTNSVTLAAGGLSATYTQSSQCVIQLDVHGPDAFNNASIISTMFRSDFAVDNFAAVGPDISPLFADDPRQMQFTSGEQQYEDRYIVEANLQVNQSVTTPTQSADALSVDITDVETDPVSWPNSTVSAP